MDRNGAEVGSDVQVTGETTGMDNKQHRVF